MSSSRSVQDTKATAMTLSVGKCSHPLFAFAFRRRRRLRQSSLTRPLYYSRRRHPSRSFAAGRPALMYQAALCPAVSFSSFSSSLILLLLPFRCPVLFLPMPTAMYNRAAASSPIDCLPTDRTLRHEPAPRGRPATIDGICPITSRSTLLYTVYRHPTPPAPRALPPLPFFLPTLSAHTRPRRSSALAILDVFLMQGTFLLPF